MIACCFLCGNLKLEGRLAVPAGCTRAPAVVLCHPHPLYGGSMNNNVIDAVSRELVSAGFAALCFNFRGVGRSEGTFDDGEGEQEDALAAVEFLRAREEVDPAAVGLMGYSFGGWVALAAGMRNSAIRAVAAVSPMTVPEPVQSKPCLVVGGTEDSLVPVSGLLKEQERIIGGGSGRLELIEGADHFWLGYEDQAARLIVSFFMRYLM